MNENNTDSGKEFRELLIEHSKLLLETINNRERIHNLENQLLKHKFRYKLLDFILILNAVDIMVKSIFGIGIIGCIIYIYRYIISLF